MEYYYHGAKTVLSLHSHFTVAVYDDSDKSSRPDSAGSTVDLSSTSEIDTTTSIDLLISLSVKSFFLI